MALARLLDLLTSLVAAEDHAAVDELRTRLAQRRFRVLVVGEAKRGKSTLVNALLGRPLLPVGVTPVTAVATEIRGGSPTRLEVRYRDGRNCREPVEALADLVTEHGNPDNQRGVERITAYVDAPLLSGEVELVDTPGTGSVFAHNTAEATATLDTMDAAVLLLSADPPISDSERELLAAARDRSVSLFVVLNKVDRLDPSERAESLRFTTDVTTRALGAPVPVYPLSSSRALAARQDCDEAGLAASGLTDFETALAGYLTTGRRRDLPRSLAGHAHRLAARTRDEAALTLRAAEMTAGDAAAQVARFRRHLDGLDERRRDAMDVINATAARLLADLNDATRWETPGLTAQVHAAVTAHLDGPLASVDAATIERDGRTYTVKQTRHAVDAWRAQRAKVLDDGLAALDRRLTEGISREVDDVRRAACQLLDLQLAVPTTAGSLLSDTGADYDFAPPVDEIDELAGPVRRRLPGALGRRAARHHLYDQLDQLVPKQVGRTRAAFQQALATASRELTRQMERRYTEALSGLVRAMDAATDLATATAAEAAARRAEVAARIDALDAVTTELAAQAAAAASAGTEDR